MSRSQGFSDNHCNYKVTLKDSTTVEYYVARKGYCGEVDSGAHNINAYLYQYPDSSYNTDDEDRILYDSYYDGTDGSYGPSSITTEKLNSDYMNGNTAYFRLKVEADDRLVFDKEFTLSINDTPSTPYSINVPSSVQQGNSISVSWSSASGNDGTLSGYTLQRQINGGTWTTVANTNSSTRSYTDTALSDWNTVVYRVRAKNTNGKTSSYRQSNTITITHNTPPVISGSDINLGTFGMNKPNNYTYTIIDAQNNVVTVTEKLDGIVKRTYNPTLGVSNLFSFTDEEWIQVLNGNHTITITADDHNGGITTRTLTFTKQVNQIQFYLNPCLVASNMPSKAQESIIAELPTGSTCKVEICNNFNDTNPTWEDITDKVLNDKKIFINNTIKTASQWGYNIRVTIDRGTATGPVWISGGSGFFE